MDEIDRLIDLWDGRYTLTKYSGGQNAVMYAGQRLSTFWSRSVAQEERKKCVAVMVLRAHLDRKHVPFPCPTVLGLTIREIVDYSLAQEVARKLEAAIKRPD